MVGLSENIRPSKMALRNHSSKRAGQMIDDLSLSVDHAEAPTDATCSR